MPVQAGRVRATYRDGMLEVSLPRAEEVRQVRRGGRDSDRSR
jgi:HSP20 family molecular chaperone IbpA